MLRGNHENDQMISRPHELDVADSGFSLRVFGLKLLWDSVPEESND